VTPWPARGDLLHMRGVVVCGIQLREVLMFVARCVLDVGKPWYRVDKKDEARVLVDRQQLDVEV
jgi:hypothetical protein